MSHLNIKPFHCKYCYYTSNKKTNLTTHLERVHNSRTIEADMVINEDDMVKMSNLREKLSANPKGIFKMDENGVISVVNPQIDQIIKIPQPQNILVKKEVAPTKPHGHQNPQVNPVTNQEFTIETFLNYKPNDSDDGAEGLNVDDTVTVMGSKPYKCHHCNYNTNKKVNVLSHCEIRHGFKGRIDDIDIIGKENKFECKVCNMGFVTLPRYVSHVTTHLKIKPFRCAHCDYGSNKKLNVQQHCERIHVKYEEIVVDDEEMSKLNELKDILTKEVEKEMRLTPPSPTNGQMSFFEDMPRQILELKPLEPEQLQIMVKEDHQDLKCSSCNFVAGSRDQLLIHCQKEHDITPGDDPAYCPLIPRTSGNYYQCVKCLEEFKFRQTLLRHLMGHLDIAPYKCKLCQHTSRFKSCIRKHVSKAHDSSLDDVHTDVVKLEKVKVLTTKMRIYYSANNHGEMAGHPSDDKEYEEVIEMEDEFE